MLIIVHNLIQSRQKYEIYLRVLEEVERMFRAAPVACMEGYIQRLILIDKGIVNQQNNDYKQAQVLLDAAFRTDGLVALGEFHRKIIEKANFYLVFINLQLQDMAMYLKSVVRVVLLRLIYGNEQGEHIVTKFVKMISGQF